MIEGLFNLVTLLPLPVWLSMILFPRARFTQRLVLSYWPFIVLGGVYVLFLLVSLPQGIGSFALSFRALQSAFAHDWGFLAGWTHYLTLDLFAGVWMFRDAKYWGIRPGWFLVLTLFAGPLGLAAYLLLRERKTKSGPARTVN